MSGVFLYKQCPSSLPLFQRTTNKQTIVCSYDRLLEHTIVCFYDRLRTYDRLLVSVTLEKREGACALFVQKNSRHFIIIMTKHNTPQQEIYTEVKYVNSSGMRERTLM